MNMDHKSWIDINTEIRANCPMCGIEPRDGLTWAFERLQVKNIARRLGIDVV